MKLYDLKTDDVFKLTTLVEDVTIPPDALRPTNQDQDYLFVKLDGMYAKCRRTFYYGEDEIYYFAAWTEVEDAL